MEIRNLEIQLREGIGKSVTRKIRRDGIIPAVFYGPGRNPIPLVVNPQSLMSAIDTQAGENTLITLNAKGMKDLDKKVVIMKDRQLHPITKDLIHVDFYEIAMDKTIEVEIPIVTVGKAIGLEDGGTLQFVRKEILVECLPNNIPEKIEIDVTPLKMGDSIHIKDITAPDGVKFVFDKNYTVINMAAPTKEEEPVAAAEGVEGEVPVEGEAVKTEAAKEGEKPADAKKEASAKKEAPAKKEAQAKK